MKETVHKVELEDGTKIRIVADGPLSEQQIAQEIERQAASGTITFRRVTPTTPQVNPDGSTPARLITPTSTDAQPITSSAAGLPEPPPSSSDTGNGPPIQGVERGVAALGNVVDGIIPNLGRSMAQGAAYITGNDVNYAATHYDDLQRRYEEAHPYESTAGDVAGFAGGMFLPGANVVRGGRIAGAAGNAAIDGALYTGASGALDDRGDGRLSNMSEGFGGGAVIGGLTGGAIRTGHNIGQSVRANVPGVDQAVTGGTNLARRAVGLDPVVSGATAQGQRQVGEIFDGSSNISTGMGRGEVPATPANVLREVNTRQQDLNYPAIPADVTVDSRKALNWAVSGRGPTTNLVRNSIDARQAQSASRVSSAVQDELGPVVDPIQEIQKIKLERQEAVGPMYQQAYAIPPLRDENYQAIANTPAFKDALPRAVDNILNTRGAPRPEDLGFAQLPDGSWTADNITTEGLHNILQTLDRSIQRDQFGHRILQGDPAAYGRAQVHDALSRHLIDTNPEFAAVQRRYADDSAIINAQNAGGNIRSMTGSEAVRYQQTIPEVASSAFGSGARSAIATDAMVYGGNHRTGNVADRTRQGIGLSTSRADDAGDPAKVRVIEEMNGTPGAMSRLDDKLEAEAQGHLTFREMNAGSQTQPKQQYAESMNNMNAMTDVVFDIYSGGIAGAMTRYLTGNKQGTLQFQQGVKDEIARTLAANNVSDIRSALNVVRQRAAVDEGFRNLLIQVGIRVDRMFTMGVAQDSENPRPFIAE